MRIESAIECRRRTTQDGRRISCYDWRRGCARPGKRLVAAVGGGGAGSGDDPEMIRSARTQSRDVRTNILGRVPRITLVSCDGTVVRGSPVLEVYGCSQSLGIDRAIKRC